MFGRSAIDHSIQQFDEALSRLGPDCSAPLIAALTEIARHFANPHIIVLLVELRTLSNPINVKLPVIYLMDSIMKLAGGVYVELFKQNILILFPATYAMVEGPVINSMIKVFTLWKEQNILPIDILLQIEGQMTRIDQHRQLLLSGVPFPSRWPKTMNGLKNLEETLELCIVKDLYLRLLSPHHVLPSNDQLRFQQDYIIGQTVLQQKLKSDLGLLSDAEVPRLLELYHTIQRIKDAGLSNGGPAPNLVSVPLSERPPPSIYPYSIRPHNQDGMMSQSVIAARPMGNRGDAGQSDALSSYPEPSFSNIASLHHFNKRAVQSLYSNLPEQCKQCGMRLADKVQLDDHLGMHLKLNKHRLNKNVLTRNWYLSLEDWLDTRGGTRIQNSAVSLSAAATRVKRDSDEMNEKAAPKQCIAADDNQKMCAGCGEKLEVEWDKQEEIWLNYDAVRSEIDGKIYHVKCHSGGNQNALQPSNPSLKFGSPTAAVAVSAINPASIDQQAIPPTSTLGSSPIVIRKAGNESGSAYDYLDKISDADNVTPEHLRTAKRPVEEFTDISGTSPKKFKSAD